MLFQASIRVGLPALLSNILYSMIYFCDLLQKTKHGDENGGRQQWDTGVEPWVGLRARVGDGGQFKSQGRVSNNSSVSEARTRWRLALLLCPDTFLFTADFNSLWTPALAWPCSGGKIDILYCYLKTLKSFSLTGAVLCSKLSCSSVWSSTFYILKGHLLCVTAFQRFCLDSLSEDLIKLTIAMTLLMNLLRRRQMIQEACFKPFLHKRAYFHTRVYLWTPVHVFMEATFCQGILNE